MNQYLILKIANSVVENANRFSNIFPELVARQPSVI